jgi:hypothetical protein
MERANGLSQQQKSILRWVLQSVKMLGGGGHRAEQIVLLIGVDW